MNVYAADHASRLKYVKLGIFPEMNGDMVTVSCLEDSGT